MPRRVIEVEDSSGDEVRVPRKSRTRSRSAFNGIASGRTTPSRRGTVTADQFYSKPAHSSARRSVTRMKDTSESLFLPGPGSDDLESIPDAEEAESSPVPGAYTPMEYEYLDESEVEALPGPSRGHVYVDMPFRRLYELEEYAYEPGLEHPTKESRAWLLETQGNRPRTPSRRLPPRSAREAVLTAPRWKTNEDYTPDDGEEFVSSGEEDEVQAYTSSEDGMRLRRSNRRHRHNSSDDEMVLTRAQKGKQKASSRKRRRSSSASSAASYNPRGRRIESEGESEIDEIYWSDPSSRSDSPITRNPTRKVLERHRDFCEKCQLGQADVLLKKALKRKAARRGKPKKRKEDDEDRISDDEEARLLEGWLECERCVTSSHWYCLPDEQKRDVMVAFSTRNPGAPKRSSIKIDESGTYICARCTDYPVCFVCKEEHMPGQKASEEKNEEDKAPAKDANVSNGHSNGTTEANGTDAPTANGTIANGHASDEPIIIDGDSENEDAPPQKTPAANGSKTVPRISSSEPINPGLIKSAPAPLLFRCYRCKQGVHYEHLRNPFGEDERYTLPRLAAEYQTSSVDGAAWFCHCCRDWKWQVDKIIAWRPLPADAVEPERQPGELPRMKDRLPREYLIKFRDRSFRHLAWVPHTWLLVVNANKLRHFLERGARLDLVTDSTLAAKGDQMAAPTIMDVLDDAEEQHGRHFGEQTGLEAKWEGHGPPPDDNAEESIPMDWSTVDRLLDVYLLPPKSAKKKPQVSKNRVVSSASEEEADDEPELQDGIKPDEPNMVEISRWENMVDRTLTKDDVDDIAPRVTWFLAKWQDLQYDQSCFDTPPPADDPRYPAFKHALKRFLAARKIVIPALSSRLCRERDALAEELSHEDPPREQPDCVSGGKLMPFQLEGFQWLMYKHWRREGCILADDMGLGKTIQVCSFIGYLCSKQHSIYPHLIVVPNSTITNWVREFEKWVPHVRVVPYYGMQASRKIINKYELFHLGKQGKPDGLKAHVVLTTYDMIISEFRVFNNIPRWETLIVDEGQRLKSDSSLLFNKLKPLNTIHRVLLTGTPLNNNIRELFNLLNFLDPDTFNNLRELEEKYEVLNQQLVQELHETIKPYILRRIKSQVLRLPPKVEIIVPISMTPVQKRLTKILLTRNAELISTLRNKKKAQAAAAKRKEAEREDAAEASEVEAGIKDTMGTGDPSRAQSERVDVDEGIGAGENGEASGEDKASEAETAEASASKQRAESEKSDEAPAAAPAIPVIVPSSVEET